MRTETRMGVRWWAVLALIAIGATPGMAAGQDKAERVRESLPADALAQVEAIVESAQRDGIPIEPLYDKVLEGAAKRVPAARIIPAVSAYADRLLVARTTLGPVADAWVVAGADAIARGVPTEVVGRVGAERRGDGPMSLVVLGDLVESGVPTDRAVEVVEEAMRSGQEEADFVAIPRAVDRFIRDGHSPHDAAVRLVRHMRRGLPVRRVTDVPNGLLQDRPGPPVAPGVEPVDRPRRSGG